MLHIIEFIKNHPLHWEELLTEGPYNLKIKRDEAFPHLISLSYDMINSDFSEPVVKEARGIIIDIEDERNPIVVCHAFNKFFNYGEAEAAKIDWSTAKVQEKVDGSLVKLWFEHRTCQWILSSNSCIQASKAILSSGHSIYFIFLIALDHLGYHSIEEFAADKRLDRDKTYIFELVSPYNQIVIQYERSMIYHIGIRDMKTGNEINERIEGIPVPATYPLSSLWDCVDAAHALNVNGKVEKEGFVVVDAAWHRIKIKSPDYVALHHVSNGISMEAALHIIRLGEVEEVISYFPKYAITIRELENKFRIYKTYLKGETIKARISWKKLNHDRKEFALKYSMKFPEVFKILDLGWDVEAYLAEQTDKQLLKRIEKIKI